MFPPGSWGGGSLGLAEGGGKKGWVGKLKTKGRGYGKLGDDATPRSGGREAAAGLGRHTAFTVFKKKVFDLVRAQF